ncbi:uncharacterized protein PITG_06763 [Phytophthora infestans T30-4]|uniref:Uncharacterized protein n=1 Tax=Phytophthora infestans (strain T30-4) TaxID=403677 RepID=D0N819_PHYIT|nr:uncharacterized protein PITG_06763 [Phytophthora infestans T30-4]EEY53136.1 conserved hypothetical protein [Phytophthora infestans T30-4]|eukprot:XP_002904754.1 conserved hypothetical protein [Phytophthora infestans T30-4]
MAAAIERLTQDFARQQEELTAAYKRLQQYELRERNGEFPMASQDLKNLLEEKDLALAEALQQRNVHRVELDKAKALIAELRTLHLDTTGGRAPQAAWKANSPLVPGSPSTNMISRNAITSTQYAQANIGIRTPMTPAATAALLGCPGAIDVPHDERFDVASAYKQRSETGDVFWRKQYKEAVRMRKSQQSSAIAQQQSPHPSLKIFSSRDNRKKKTDQVRDETVPSTRYIGISSRQNNIIKEQHRLLAKQQD